MNQKEQADFNEISNRINKVKDYLNDRNTSYSISELGNMIEDFITVKDSLGNLGSIINFLTLQKAKLFLEKKFNQELSELGILAFYEYTRFHDEKYYQSLINVSGNIKSLLDNHKSLLNPLYDEHIIEVCLASYVLLVAGEREYLKNWLYKSFDHIIYACTVLGKYYPTCTNNFYDLLYESKGNQKEYLCSSTLFFYYLELACLIKDNDLYSFVYDKTMEHFSETAIQFWFPDSTTEESIYIRNAGYSSGFSFVCNPLPKTLKEMDDIINTKKEKEISCKDFSCFKNSFTDLLFISNRHFRTPIIPDSLRVLKTILDSRREKQDQTKSN